MQPAPFSLLTVCGLEELESHSTRGVTHVLSILDPDLPDPEIFARFDPHHRTLLRFHDEIEPRAGVILPEREDVAAILELGRGIEAEGNAHVLIHCHLGVSRSTAAMTSLIAQAYPNEDEDAVVTRLEQIRRQAWPNVRMIGFADDLLGRKGRLRAAVSRLHKRRLAARPELAGIMSRLNRSREVELALLA